MLYGATVVKSSATFTTIGIDGGVKKYLRHLLTVLLTRYILILAIHRYKPHRSVGGAFSMSINAASVALLVPPLFEGRRLWLAGAPFYLRGRDD
jgi:hypothetical protein